MELLSMFYTIGYFAIFTVCMLILAVEIKRKQIMIERDSIEILSITKWGVQWQGADIPRPNSMYKMAQFGFSCACCGESAVNLGELIHSNNCDIIKGV